MSGISAESWQEVSPCSSSIHSTGDEAISDSDCQAKDGDSIDHGHKHDGEVTVSDANVEDPGLILTLRGGLMLSFVIGVWMAGMISPVLAVVLAWYGGPWAYTLLMGLLLASIYPYIGGEANDGDRGSWMSFRRAIPNWGQYWHRSCGRIYEGEGPYEWNDMPPTVFCYHPHGVFTQAYIINGSLNQELPNIVGLLATSLYHAPIFRLVFGMWAGASAPASKKEFIKQMDKGNSFGIIPGGFQEAAVGKVGTDRVWLKQRKGFVKYALQYGYRLRPVFTFGECDTYWNAQGLWKLRIWLTSQNLPAVFPWGVWWCPLLPRRVHLMTVFGKSIALPKLENPSKEDVDKWHGAYIEALTEVYDRYKAQYASNPTGELDVW